MASPEWNGFGFKLHLVCNDKGELLNFVITSGNVDDRVPLTSSNLLKEVMGKLFADKGYSPEVNLITIASKSIYHG